MTKTDQNHCTIVVSLACGTHDGEVIRLHGPTVYDERERWRMTNSSNKGDNNSVPLEYIDLVHLRNALDALIVAYEGSLKRTV